MAPPGIIPQREEEGDRSVLIQRELTPQKEEKPNAKLTPEQVRPFPMSATATASRKRPKKGAMSHSHRNAGKEHTFSQGNWEGIVRIKKTAKEGKEEETWSREENDVERAIAVK